MCILVRWSCPYCFKPLRDSKGDAIEDWKPCATPAAHTRDVKWKTHVCDYCDRSSNTERRDAFRKTGVMPPWKFDPKNQAVAHVLNGEAYLRANQPASQSSKDAQKNSAVQPKADEKKPKPAPVKVAPKAASSSTKQSTTPATPTKAKKDGTTKKEDTTK